jgi:hypothetical protein
MILGLYGCNSMVPEDKPEEWARQAAKRRAEALAALPYERLQVSGSAALREWERLKTAGRGAPIVIGSDEDLSSIAVPFRPDYWTNADEPVLAETLAKADQLTHPEGLNAYRQAEEERFDQLCQEDPRVCERYDAFLQQLRDAGIDTDFDQGPPVGQWPEQPPFVPALTVAKDLLTGRPFDRVFIILVPTDDWTTIPAYLRWGNWNANPPPEYHVAALRSWRDRYGAELAGLSLDVMNIRVATKPKSRDEAMALAREHYAYCNDTVDQGVGTLSNLAAALKSHDWWFFWWD